MELDLLRQNESPILDGIVLTETERRTPVLDGTVLTGRERGSALYEMELGQKEEPLYSIRWKCPK
jgi:hypothetical protein